MSKNSKNISKPKEPTRRIILARSGNQCAFPTCNNPIFIKKEMKGRISHIKGKKPNGPRYDPKQEPEERHGVDNLIALCDEHGQHVDDPKLVQNYPVKFLQNLKKEHEEKIENSSDKNWILPPNSIVGGNLGSTPVHFWVDRKGQPRVYTEEQLAKCSTLQQLSMDISNLNTTLETLRKIDEPMVTSVFKQQYAKVGENSINLYAHIVDHMSVVPEVTFGEFIRFIVQGHDATQLIESGAEKLRDKIEGRINAFWSYSKSRN